MLQEAMTVCTQTVCGSFPQRLLALVKLACIASANPNALLQRLKVRDACHRRCESQHPEAHAWVLRLLEPLLLAPIDRLPQRIVGRLFAFSGSFALVDASQHPQVQGSIMTVVAPLRTALQTFMQNLLHTYERGNSFRWSHRPECVQAAFALIVCTDKSVAALMGRLVKVGTPGAASTTDALRQLATEAGMPPSSKCYSVL
jgi:hypothetical protein